MRYLLRFGFCPLFGLGRLGRYYLQFFFFLLNRNVIFFLIVEKKYECKEKKTVVVCFLMSLKIRDHKQDKVNRILLLE